jgi:hypothetical protein
MSMKDPFEVLRAKEQELAVLRRQIEALRLSAPLLGEEDEENILAEVEVQRKAMKLP